MCSAAPGGGICAALRRERQSAAVRADKKNVVAVLLLSVLAAALAVAAGFHLVVQHGVRPRISPQRVSFAAALFWFWYLAPGLSDKSAVASVLALLTP